MSTFNVETDSFTDFIQKAIKAEVEKIIKEEAEKASKEVINRIHDKANLIALNILKFYEVQSMRDRVVITVKKSESI